MIGDPYDAQIPGTVTMCFQDSVFLNNKSKKCIYWYTAARQFTPSEILIKVIGNEKNITE